MFHRIWFGPKPMPSSYEDYWQAWQRQFPDCEFITWRDDDIAKLDLSKATLARLTNPVSRADLARYEILHMFGGIYLDCDILPYNHFSVDELTSQLTVCNETESRDYCSIGFIAAPPGHPIFLDLIGHIERTEIDETRPNISTGPWLFGAYLHHHQHRRLPVSAFYPYLYDEPLSSIRKKNLENTLGIHVWGGAWLAPELKKNKLLQLLDKGDIAEPATLVSNFECQWSDDMRVLIDTIRDVREKSAEIAVVLNQNMTIDADSRAIFEFGKVVRWLLEEDADCMVWQIGAADGILVDPLRPAMVNFDPPALLLEPNPYMFELLQQGYRNNRNATLLPLAYGTGETELILNAVNPEKAARLNLPRWVLGISSVYDDKNALGGLTIDETTTRLIQSCVERIPVPVTNFQELAGLAEGRHPDILVIDAEGMDKVIIDDILRNGCRPLVIHFEIQCMDEQDSRELIATLSGEYVLVEFGNDITAYRNDVILSYAKAAYINNGLSTILTAGLYKLNGLQKPHQLSQTM